MRLSGNRLYQAEELFCYELMNGLTTFFLYLIKDIEMMTYLSLYEDVASMRNLHSTEMTSSDITLADTFLLEFSTYKIKATNA